jgi:hypothetical protein
MHSLSIKNRFMNSLGHQLIIGVGDALISLLASLGAREYATTLADGERPAVRGSPTSTIHARAEKLPHDRLRPGGVPGVMSSSRKLSGCKLSGQGQRHQRLGGILNEVRSCILSRSDEIIGRHRTQEEITCESCTLAALAEVAPLC